MADLSFDPNTPRKPCPIASSPFWMGTGSDANATLGLNFTPPPQTPGMQSPGHWLALTHQQRCTLEEALVAACEAKIERLLADHRLSEAQARKKRVRDAREQIRYLSLKQASARLITQRLLRADLWSACGAFEKPKASRPGLDAVYRRQRAACSALP
jgi:hypothetical protein